MGSMGFLLTISTTEANLFAFTAPKLRPFGTTTEYADTTTLKITLTKFI